jgi:hypothetical protein
MLIPLSNRPLTSWLKYGLLTELILATLKVRPFYLGGQEVRTSRSYWLAERVFTHNIAWLVGQAPVPLVRKSSYLSTQSIVHACITWRFHHAWRHEPTRTGDQTTTFLKTQNLLVASICAFRLLMREPCSWRWRAILPKQMTTNVSREDLGKIQEKIWTSVGWVESFRRGWSCIFSSAQFMIL